MKQEVLVKEDSRLSEVVTDLLREAGHPNPTDWQQGLHPDAAISNDQQIQQFLINRQLRLVIGSYPEDTTNVRYCLLETSSGTPEQWAQQIKAGVVPCMVRHAQPTEEATA